MDFDETAYRKYAPELIRFAATLVGPSTAEDLTSSAFLHATGSRRWALVDDQRSYLYRTVINEARQQHRRDRRRVAREFVAAQQPKQASTESTVELAMALATLTNLQRAIVFLVYWEGRTAAECAETLSMSVRSIERQLHQARTRLRSALDE